MIEVLKMVKSVKFMRVISPREALPLEIRPKKLPGGQDWTVFENFPNGW